MWLTLVVAAVSAVFLLREALAVRRGVSSRRQFTLRATGCILLLSLALLLQFKEAIYLPAGEASEGVRLMRLLQFSAGVFILITALVLVALMDARETLQRYLREHKQMMDDLVRKSPASPPPSSGGKRDGNPS